MSVTDHSQSKTSESATPTTTLAAANAVWSIGTLAGTGVAGYADSKATATATAAAVSGAGAVGAQFDSPCGVAWDGKRQRLYVADFKNHAIRVVDTAGPTAGRVTTLCGAPPGAAPAAGYVDGALSSARFNRPRGLAVDVLSDSLVVADQHNHVLRRVPLATDTAAAAVGVTTIAGTGTAGMTNGTGAAAQFAMPFGVAVCPSTGVIYVADNEYNRVRAIRVATATTTAPAAPAAAAAPSATVTASKAVVVPEHAGDRVVTVWTLAGSGDDEHADGPAAEAKLDTPRYLCVKTFDAPAAAAAATTAAPAPVLYVTTDMSIRAIDTASGYVSSVAKSERLNPFGIAYNPRTDSVVWGDFMLHTLSTKTVPPPVRPAAATATGAAAAAAVSSSAATDSKAPPAAAAAAKVPPSMSAMLSVGGVGDERDTAAATALAFAAAGANAPAAGGAVSRGGPVQKLTGVMNRPGAAGAVGAAPAPASTAAINFPEGIAVDPVSGTIYFADSGNHCVRALRPPATA